MEALIPAFLYAEVQTFWMYMSQEIFIALVLRRERKQKLLEIFLKEALF